MEPTGLDIEALYERYGPMVLRRCRFLLREEDQALDTTHDVFVQLLRHRERLSGEHPSSLLFTIATRLSLNRLRGRRRDPDLPGDEVLERISQRRTSTPRSFSTGCSAGIPSRRGRWPSSTTWTG